MAADLCLGTPATLSLLVRMRHETPPSSGPTTNVKLGARLEHSHSVADVGHASDRLQTPVKSPALAAEQQPLRPDGKLELGCDWCGNSFIPRHRSGGSKQKFCSRECQRTSNRERQRTHRRAAYVAPRTTPTISHSPTRTKRPRASPRSQRCTPGKPGSSTSPTASGLSSSSA